MFGKSVFCALALGGSLIVPATSFAQSALGTPPAGSAGAGSAGVSGIPIGPGSAGGTNNSVYDPSGIGNASRTPSLPSQAAIPVTPASPGYGNTVVGPRSLSSPRIRVLRRSAVRVPRSTRATRHRAAVTANDRRLDSRFSICRGC